MNRHILAILTLLTAVATTTTWADDKPLKGDLAKLQGKWTATVQIRPGTEMVWNYEIEGKTVHIRITPANGKPVELKEDFKIDETSKPHKSIDWIKRVDPNGHQLPDMPAIYAFDDDDTLRICQPAGGPGLRPERPKEFGPNVPFGGRAGSTLTFIRVKEKAKATSSR